MNGEISYVNQSCFLCQTVNMFKSAVKNQLQVAFPGTAHFGTSIDLIIRLDQM